MAGGLTIVGCGLGPADLNDRHREAVARAALLAGGQRLLAWFPDFAGEKMVLGAGIETQVQTLAAASRHRRVVVLASGDPLFFGVGRLFAAAVPAARLTIMPNITAAQAACARLGLPWEDCRFFSLHGRRQKLPWPLVLRAPQAVIYADSRQHPSRAAADLIAAYPAAAGRQAVLAADLGSAAEEVVRGTLGEIAARESPGLALLLLPPDAGFSPPPLALGLADENYRHEGGLITRAEIRAVILAKLRLAPGVMWDLGAGSGSVGLEAQELCPGLQVVAVEKKPERCRLIEENAGARGARVEIVTGNILEVLGGLPAPTRVFVGGAGRDIVPVVERSFARLRPGGYLVAAAVTLETRAALTALLPGAGLEMVEVAVSRAKKLGSYRLPAAENSVALYVYRKSPAVRS